MDGPIQAICTGQVTEDIFIILLLEEKSFFSLLILISRGQDVTHNLMMFGSNEEILEQEETLRKMTQLARAHFPDDDAQSDIFYPISGEAFLSYDNQNGKINLNHYFNLLFCLSISTIFIQI